MRIYKQGKRVKNYAAKINGVPMPGAQDGENRRDWTTPQEHGGTSHTAVSAALATGKNVYFPEGIYVWWNSVIAFDKGSQILEGEGGAIIQTFDSIGADKILLTVWQADNVTIRGLKFDGNKANQTQPPADNSWDDAASRISYTQLNANAANNLKIEDCEFYNCNTCSINLIACAGVEILNNHFHDSYFDPIYSSSGLTTDAVIRNNVLKDITYRDGEGDIIYRYGNGIILNGVGVKIVDNQISRTDRTGMKPSNATAATDYLIARNVLKDCDWQGIHPNRGNTFVIKDNQIDGSGNSGILLGISSETGLTHTMTISGNTITNSGTRDTGEAPTSQAGIMLAGHAYGLTIEDNTIDTCGTFGLLSVDANNVTTSNNTITGAAIRPVYIDGDGAPASLNRSWAWTMDGDKLYCNDVSTDGIKVGDYSYDLTFQNIEIHDPVETGIFLQEPDHVLVKDCTIDGSSTYAIRMVATTNSTVDGNTMTNTTFDAMIFLPLAAPNSDNITIQNNTTNVARDGIKVYGTPTNVTFSNNTYLNLSGVPGEF